MIKEELINRSPIRILEQTLHGGLGPGHLGVFVSRKGVGKTACLVHFATDHLLRGQKVVHISFSDDPHHIANWYKQVYEEVAAAYQLESANLIFDELLRDRLILHFKENGSNLTAVHKSLDIYVKQGGFTPKMIIVDGTHFVEKDQAVLQEWQNLAHAFDSQIWFSATLPANAGSAAEFIKPFIQYFSVVIELNAQQDHIQLRLLKDQDAASCEKLRLRLDPKSLLISNRRV